VLKYEYSKNNFLKDKTQTTNIYHNFFTCSFAIN